jgi:16S rRNA (guanine966-N2)-methyltransferase
MDNGKKDEAKPPLKSFDQQKSQDQSRGNAVGVRRDTAGFTGKNINREPRVIDTRIRSTPRDVNSTEKRFQSPNDSRVRSSQSSAATSRDTRSFRDPSGGSRPPQEKSERGSGFAKTNNKDFKTGRPPGKFQSRDAKPAKPKIEKVVAPLIPIVSELQIMEGVHRGKYIKNTLSPKHRLSSAKLRDAALRLIYRRVRFGRVLDLCSGAGMIGFEAISRGALLATFVERSSKMVDFIKKNMESLAVKVGHGEIFEIEAIPFLMRIEKNRREWDVVYFAPPYNSNYDEVLEFLGRGVGIRQRGCVVIEHPSQMVFPETIGSLHRWRVTEEGEVAVSFYERRQSST